MLRPAHPDEVEWVAGTVATAFAVYIPRIGRAPAPVDADYSVLVAAGEVHLLEDADIRLGVIVLRSAVDHLFVETVAVLPEAQGCGAGRRLMAFAEDEAIRRGLPSVRLYTNALMTENLRFYPMLGYRQTARRLEDGFDRIYFEKRLA